jgi:hypothetical protein
MLMGVQQEQVPMGPNKRHRRPQSHDEDDDDHHQKQEEEEKKKKPRQLPVPWMTDEMAAMATVLPRVLTEYTTEDAARFDEDMKRTDKMIDEFAASVASFHPVTSRVPVVPFITPGLLYEDEQEEEVVAVGDLLLVSKADVKMLRSFAASSGYNPLSERWFLSDRSLITQAGADEIRKSDRLFSKLYAWSQEGAREVLRHYDAAAAAAKEDSRPRPRR